jgi:hypothetical protein
VCTGGGAGTGTVSTGVGGGGGAGGGGGVGGEGGAEGGAGTGTVSTGVGGGGGAGIVGDGSTDSFLPGASSGGGGEKTAFNCAHPITLTAMRRMHPCSFRARTRRLLSSDPMSSLAEGILHPPAIGCSGLCLARPPPTPGHDQVKEICFLGPPPSRSHGSAQNPPMPSREKHTAVRGRAVKRKRAGRELAGATDGPEGGKSCRPAGCCCADGSPVWLRTFPIVSGRPLPGPLAGLRLCSVGPHPYPS